MNLRKILALLFLCIISCQASAQADTLVITPENGVLDGSLIKAYTNRWKVTFINSDGAQVPNKIWTDYGQVIELADQKYFHRVQDLYDPSMKHQDTWTNMVELESLIPVSSSTLKPSGLFSYSDYEGSVVRLRTNTKSQDSTVVQSEIDYGRKVYDWSLYGMLLVGLPFEEGLIVKMPIVGADSLQWLHAHVSAQELLKLPNDKKIKTWKVETNQSLTFWISESAPYVIKLELSLQNKAKLVWEMY